MPRATGPPATRSATPLAGCRICGSGGASEDDTQRQRFHVEVYVAPEAAEQRIGAALAAGGTVVDDKDAPSLTVIADQDGNTGVVCVDMSAATKD